MVAASMLSEVSPQTGCAGRVTCYGFLLLRYRPGGDLPAASARLSRGGAHGRAAGWRGSRPVVLDAVRQVRRRRDRPDVPVLLVLIVIPATLLLASIIAAGPGWTAARIRPAVILRSE